MIDTIHFVSKAVAEKIKPTADMALISIREPAEWVSLSKDWPTVLELEFHDFDPRKENQVNFPGNPITYDDMVAFDSDMAQNVLTFVDNLPEDIKTLYVHCHAGISRSAAVAMAISDIYAITVPALNNYSLYNKHVYRVICNTYATNLEQE